jgi:hypothetical protein
MKSSPLGELTDEQILREFIKRFDCEGAVLIYMQDETEFGFGGWKDSLGRAWVNNLFKRIKKEARLRPPVQQQAPGIRNFSTNKKTALI